MIIFHKRETLIATFEEGGYKTGSQENGKEALQLLSRPIITNHYIHLGKCNDRETTCFGLEIYIKSKLRIEKKLVLEKNQHNVFTCKWGALNVWIP